MISSVIIVYLFKKYLWRRNSKSYVFHYSLVIHIKISKNPSIHLPHLLISQGHKNDFHVQVLYTWIHCIWSHQQDLQYICSPIIKVKNYLIILTFLFLFHRNEIFDLFCSYLSYLKFWLCIWVFGRFWRHLRHCSSKALYWAISFKLGSLISFVHFDVFVFSFSSYNSIQKFLPKTILDSQ